MNREARPRHGGRGGNVGQRAISTITVRSGMCRPAWPSPKFALKHHFPGSTIGVEGEAGL